MYSHPYNDPRRGNQYSDSTADKKFKYILSLGKKHIVIFILMMFTIFGIFFLVGVFTGYSLGKKTNPSIPAIVTESAGLDNYNNFDPSAVSQGVTNSLNDVEFISQQVAIDEKFHQEDVLKINTQNQEVMTQPVEKPIKKKIKKPITKKKKSSKTPKKRSNPRYVDRPQPGVLYYYIQVIATLDVDNAKRIYDQLKIRKYPVKVKKSNKDGHYLYAIRVGLYTDKELAKRHLRLIQKGGGYTQAFMKSYKETPGHKFSQQPLKVKARDPIAKDIISQENSNNNFIPTTVPTELSTQQNNANQNTFQPVLIDPSEITLPQQ